MNYEISVIIPVYNAEKYIKACLDSIVKASLFNSLEIICIDNGSTDKSKQIIDYYIKKYNNFKLYYENEKGVSNARNIGIKKATSDYIFFLDSDDIVYPNAFEILLNKIKSQQVDIVIGSYKLFNGKMRAYKNIDFINNSQNKNVASYLNESILFNWPVWGKLFKRKIVLKNKLYFDKNLKTCEDCKFLFQYFEVSKGISTLKEPVVMYRDTPNSLTKISNYEFLQNELSTFYYFAIKYEHNKKIKNFFLASMLLKIHLIKKLNKEQQTNFYIFKKYLKKNILTVSHKQTPKLILVKLLYIILGINLGATLLNFIIGKKKHKNG